MLIFFAILGIFCHSLVKLGIPMLLVDVINVAKTFMALEILSLDLAIIVSWSNHLFIIVPLGVMRQ